MLQLLFGLANGALGVFGKHSAGVRDRNAARIANLERTWVDEILVGYWFSPTIIGWFNATQGAVMQDLMTRDTQLYAMQVTITLAVFGVNKVHKARKR